MNIQFLSSPGLALVKTYRKEPDGSLTVEPYPLARLFTNHPETPDDMKAFAACLIQHAQSGHCLLKGELGRPLTAESRANSTSPDALTDWICLDLDGVAFKTIAAFMQAIGVDKVAYTLQLSSSHGMPGKPGIRAHVFVQLDKPQHPDVLKRWLQQLNLSVPVLNNGLRLNTTKRALVWPLDVSTCQNDKLLYIAPPNLIGLKDPLAKTPRIGCVRHATKTLAFGAINVWPPEELRAKMHKRVLELRETEGLVDKCKPALYKRAGPVEYLENPGEARISCYGEDNGFRRLNLDNGDSGAYYHPIGNPEFIYNFKGEPVYKTSELDPVYYRDNTPRADTGAAEIVDPVTKDHLIYFAFRDFNDSNYYNGWYNVDQDELTIRMAKHKDQLRDFMKGRGLELGDAVLDWDQVYDPHTDVTVDIPRRRLNTFRRSDIMKSSPDELQDVCPPRSAKLIANMLGDHAPTVDHFHNWMASIVQKLDRTLTGWVLHGTQGTGKGVFFEKLLKPIFGQNIAQRSMNDLDEKFNSFLEKTFIVMIDEIHVASANRGSSANLTNKLKGYMTENYISIRKMHTEGVETKMYFNMIFTSNQKDPVEIPNDDRRHNVGFYQEKMLNQVLTDDEIDSIGDEAHALWSYWMQYPASRKRAMTVLDSQARRDLQALSATAGDLVAKALNSGDLAFFVNHVPPARTSAGSTIPGLTPYLIKTTNYRDLMKEIVHSKPLRKSLTLPEIFTIYDFLIGGVPQEQEKLKKVLAYRGIKVQPANVRDQGTKSAVRTLWKVDQAWLAQAQLDLA